MNEIIKYFESIPFSGEDLLRLVNYKSNLLTYQQLAKYEDINKAMGKHKALIILYETKKSYGHWCCVFMQNDNEISFFDSYGGYPDSQLKHINMYFRKHNNEYYPHLTYLLYKSKYKVTYNEFQFQKYQKNINTCGAWVGTRLNFRHLDVYEFAKIFMNKKIDPDELVILLILLKN